MQKKNWRFCDFYIVKCARTCWHPNKRIRNLERKKIDLIVVFNGPLIFVLQVKSTHKSYKHFCNHPNHRRNIKCILIFEHEPIEKIINKLENIFKEVLTFPKRRNPFLRPRIPLDLI